MWIIDFDQMTEVEAAQYVAPFAYVREEVKPERERGRDAAGKSAWWRMLRPRPEMRAALAGLSRFIVTPTVARHRVFAWETSETNPDHALIVFARDDDYFFGVLHSKAHEVWSLALGTWLGAGNDPRYTPSTCFETFPFPEPNEGQWNSIASAAKHLDEVRAHLIAADSSVTMTKLYNELDVLKERRDAGARAFPLMLAHERLDEAVASAYEWEWPLTDEEILGRLLELNMERTIVHRMDVNVDELNEEVAD